MKLLAFTTALFAFVANPSLRAGDDGFRPLFNGKDLTGWVHVNDHPSTWSVKDGLIVTTGLPIGFLRTDKMYENFILEFEWNHRPRKDNKEGNSGLFVWADPIPAPGQGMFARGIEVQVLVNLEYRDKKTNAITATSHGDIFSIWGAKCTPDRPHPLNWERCLPSENRAKGFGEWNHYRVTAKDGVIKLAVNGKEVSGVSKCNPRKGYLALESEGNECWFRNLRIKELPSSSPSASEVAMDGTGWNRLYNRLDLTGFKDEPGQKGHWTPADWRLVYDGKSEAKDKNLWSAKDYGDFEMIVDWRFPGKSKKKMIPVILPNGDHEKDADGKEKQIEIDDFGDSGVYLRGSGKSQVNMWCWPIGSGEVYGYRMDKKLPPEVRAGVTPKVNADKKPGQWNRFHIKMQGDRLTVVNNGVTVIENAQLPGVPSRGPIALQHHGDPVEFANVYIRELNGQDR
jgi:3-keto-disaccharide hydrolase